MLVNAAQVQDGHNDVIKGLLDSQRIAALRACDFSAVTYDPYRFFSPVFFLQGRNQILILPALATVMIWATAWAVLLPNAPRLQKHVGVLEVVSRALLPPLSFLLVFRIGRAAARFWDARKALGQVILQCRIACSTSAVAFASCPDLLDDFLRWLAVFPVAVKNFLRPRQKSNRLQELVPLLKERDAVTLLEVQFGPLLILDHLRKLAFVASSQAETESAVRSQCYRAVNTAIDDLTAAWGTMERIQNTPLPFVYVAHLRTILLLYLYVSSLTAVALFGHAALPGVLVTCWALLGVEAAAVECSHPFQRRPNHLQLGRASIVIAQCMAQTIRTRQANSSL